MSRTARQGGPSTWRSVRALRRQISLYPALYLPLRRRRKPGTVVSRQTDLLIEGFPRSANTWTEALIRHCSPGDDIRLSHHSHAAAHVRHAHALGVPVMVLYRDPDDAVRSYLTLYNNNLDPRDAYLDYIAFYRTTWPLHGELVKFFRFEDVVQRPTDTVAALRDGFGLDLDPQRATGEGAKNEAIYRRMDEKAARLKRDRGLSGSRPGTATGEKERQQALAASAIKTPQAQAARRRARALYETLSSSLPARESTG